MLLAIDIGNTNITCGLFHCAKWLSTTRLEVEHSGSPGQLIRRINTQFAQQASADTAVSAAIIVSVVPSVTPGVVQAVVDATGVTAAVVGETLPIGIAVVYEPPSSVGMDRLVNAVAATALNEQAGWDQGAIIVDLGTATTIDGVSPEGTFVGGVIAPGIATSQQGLVDAAAQLETVPLEAPPCTLGKSTRGAMQSGLVFGHACMIDGLVERLQKEVSYPSRVYATGGLSPLIAAHAQCIDHLEPNLTLHGLKIIAERSGLLPAV